MKKLLTRAALVAISASHFALAIGLSTAASAQEVESQSESGEQGEIIVSGIRRSLEDAVNRKRSADSIIDGISAEDIGDFPDENLAESLQRITGVQIERNGGEGTAISIRGLGPQFNRVLVNGRTAPSDAGQRDFNFLVLASELVSSIAVAKSPTADVAEGGVGGTVFIETPKPLDIGKTRITASAFGSYDFAREKLAPRFAGLVSTTFADNRIGILLSGSYSLRKFRSDVYNQNGYTRSSANFQNFATANNLTRPVFEPENIQIDATTTDRERINAYAAIQFEPIDGLNLTGDLFYSKFNDLTYRTRLQIPPNRGGYVPLELQSADDGDLTLIDVGNSFSNVDNRNFDTNSDLLIAGFKAEWASGPFSVTLDGSYGEANRRRETLATIIDIPRRASNRTVFDYTSGNRIPDISFINYDPANYGSHILRFVRVDIDDASDIEYAFAADGKYELTSGFITALYAGARYSDREFFNDQITTDNCNFGNCISALTPGIQNILPPGAVTEFPVDNFLGREAGNFPRTWATADPIHLRDHFLPNGLPPLTSRPANFVNVREKTTAFYARTDFAGDIGVPFSGNAGVRYVITDMVSSGFVPTPIALDTVSRPGDVTFIFGAPQLLASDRRYNNLLWSFNAKFDVTDTLLLRLAAGRVMARPEISFLSPGFSALSPENRQATSGNPDLDPFLATQFDLSLEWYSERAGTFTAAGFYKKISSVTQTLTSFLPISFQGVTQSFNFTQPENADGGNIYGVELAYQRDFEFLPAPLDNLGMVANYTYADSSITGSNPFVTDRIFSLEGLSKHNANLILFYEDRRFGIRAAYNYRSSFLAQTLGVFQLPEFRDSFGQLDASANFSINDRLTISVEALNIFNAEQFQYSSDPSRVRFIEYTGARIQFGARATF
ncbi:TonB-dependent receptor [Erythrobacter sp. NFXS35]|uniref:TonB-dependent receptor n=1 Tax=Erythrobacter sp. NFXS35 TaxID=2818436 RepID=UPI0032DF5E8C